ncbi:MAG: P1 family peptidase [Fidelibacterota bacterium]|nr:MAG: P1 family peptidase [Candidatus Neomarinimicrobiota bacterium]
MEIASTVKHLQIPELFWLLLSSLIIACSVTAQSERPRARDIGLTPGILPPGPLNAITDVVGVQVGHSTLIKGEAVRTGVTAILPHGGNLFREKVPAAVYVGNGFGKAAGFLQVQELGHIESPILLTNTLSVGTALAAGVQWSLQQPGNEDVLSVNVVVGETNDGDLNDIRGQHVTVRDVIAAIEAAASGPVAEGSIGAGTGTRAFGWKGGIGTASRILPPSLGGYTVGALVQSNFGGILTMDGIPVGRLLGRYRYREHVEPDAGNAPRTDDQEGGSCMMVLATDAPASPRNLQRLAKRAVLGLARTGSFMSNGSGDFVIAFSTANRIPSESDTTVLAVSYLRNDAMSPLFLAAVESVEEAVYNSLLQATTITGRDSLTVQALPLDRLQEIIQNRR